MASYSDDFNRAALGSNWLNIDGTWDIASSTVLRYVSGGTNQVSTQYDTPLDTTDHKASIKRTAGASNAPTGLFVRGSDGVETHYYYYEYANGGGSWWITKMVTGTATVLTTGTGADNSFPVTLEMTANGSDLSVKRNGSAWASTTDSSLTGKYCGAVALATRTGQLDDWSASDLATVTALPEIRRVSMTGNVHR